MKPFATLLTSLIIPMCVFSQSPGDLVITEIMYNPKTVSDANGEYFEVFNTTNAPIDINHWIITDDGNDYHYIDSETPILVPAQGYFVFGRKQDVNINGGYESDYVYSSFTLSNTEDEINLHAPTGLIIDKVVYNSANFPNVAGKSMGSNTLSGTDNDSAEYWEPSEVTYGDGDYGTPGESNSSTLPALSVHSWVQSKASSEIYPNPVPSGVEFVNVALPSQTLVKIYDLEGRLVATKKVNANKLAVEFLASGMYILQSQMNSEIFSIKLVIL